MAARRKPHIFGIILLLVTGLSGFTAGADSWPRELYWNGGSMQVFQPEIDTILTNTIEARAALSIRQNSSAEPIFAAIRFEADTLSQKGDTLQAKNIRLMDIRFSKQDEGEQEQLTALVENSLASITLELELQTRTASKNSLATNEDFDGIKADPPRIILSGKPAILVFIDGEPRIEKIENSNLSRVVNTPFSIIVRQNNYYLAASDSLWYRANNALGPWISIDNADYDVPAEVLAVARSQQDQNENTANPPSYPRPDVIVATEPTELIIYDGAPSWSPLEGMNLLYMSNTDNDVFLDLESSQNYVLLSGRWYKGRVGASDVPWQAVANDALPNAFQNIEDYLRAQEVMTHIAGTQQSRDALLDNSLPRTTAVDPGENTFTPEWDGNPQFETVRGTRSLQYALNTPDSIFKYQHSYYACEDGVWYTSNSPWGGWTVASHVPDIIYDIPASNPHHNVTYVRIYDTTPERVYVGYTPGYLGSYTYHGSVVYGTGWRYRPWSNNRYYARPSTWGFNTYYDGWNGWAYSNSFYDVGYPLAHYSRHYGRRAHNYPFFGYHKNRHSSHYTADRNHYRNRDHNRDSDRGRWSGKNRDRDRNHNRNRNHDSGYDGDHERGQGENRDDTDRHHNNRRGSERGGNANDNVTKWVAKTTGKRSIKHKPRQAAAARTVSRPTHAFTEPDRNQARHQNVPRRIKVNRSRSDSRRSSGQLRNRPAPNPAGLRNVDKRQIAKIRNKVKKRNVHTDGQSKSTKKPKAATAKRQDRPVHRIAKVSNNRNANRERRSRKDGSNRKR